MIIDSLSERLGETLGMAIDQGFGLPLHVAIVANNGSMLFARYDEGEGGLSPKFLGQNVVDGTFSLPMKRGPTGITTGRDTRSFQMS